MRTSPKQKREKDKSKYKNEQFPNKKSQNKSQSQISSLLHAKLRFKKPTHTL